MNTIHVVTVTSLLLLAVLLCGCTGQIPVGPPPPSPVPGAGADLPGTSWVLTGYDDGSGTLLPVISGSEITAAFDSDGRISGSAGCNSYGGSYVVNGSGITIGPLATTLMECTDPAGVADQETAYLAALQSAASYRTSTDRLELAAASGAVVLVFAPAPPESPGTLTEKTWQLTAYADGEGNQVSVHAGTEVTAFFGGDGMITGSAGCNRYFAPYNLNGSGISVGPVGSTRMFCSTPEGVMEQERAYLAALEEASLVSVQGDALTIRDGEGMTLLTFVSGTSASSSLAGSAWTLQQLKETGDGLTDVIPGTTITLAFPDDVNLEGSGGCNRYAATFAREGNRISIGPIAVTQMYCSVPEGAMEQENTYLALLKSTRGFSVEGDRLTFSDGGGSTILVFLST
jgi:heat shock protein HslJ